MYCMSRAFGGKDRPNHKKCLLAVLSSTAFLRPKVVQPI